MTKTSVQDQHKPVYIIVLIGIFFPLNASLKTFSKGSMAYLDPPKSQLIQTKLSLPNNYNWVNHFSLLCENSQGEQDI